MLINLLSAYLVKKTEKRLCIFSKIKNLDFFFDIDWDRLINFDVKPPFFPEVQNLKIYLYSKQYNMKYSDYIEKKIPEGINGKLINDNMVDSKWDKDF